MKWDLWIWWHATTDRNLVWFYIDRPVRLFGKSKEITRRFCLNENSIRTARLGRWHKVTIAHLCGASTQEKRVRDLVRTRLYYITKVERLTGFIPIHHTPRVHGRLFLGIRINWAGTGDRNATLKNRGRKSSKRRRIWEWWKIAWCWRVGALLDIPIHLKGPSSLAHIFDP